MQSRPRRPTFRSKLTIGAALIGLATGVLAPPMGPARADATFGQWAPIESWPLVSISAVVLNSGDLLVWDGWEHPQPTYVYRPETHQFVDTVISPDAIFCGAQVHLPDGRVMVAGGHGAHTTGQIGIVNTNVFNPATGTWSRMADMNRPRWYPTLTQLADGRFLVLSGNTTDVNHWADTPEVYDPATDKWSLLDGVSTSEVHEVEYPATYLLPNGKTFTIAPSADKSFTLDVVNQVWTGVGGASGVVNGSSVMYRPGKILYSGGAARESPSSLARATTSVIDMTSGTPDWQHTTEMKTARVYHTLVMLADGKVLSVGGNANGSSLSPTVGVPAAEIWDPATERWSTVASLAASRSYHSTAVMRRDGTVLVAGGGRSDGVGPEAGGEYSAQVYSPPYLFAGPRPTITGSPEAAAYNSSMTIKTPDAASIKAVNLVSLGSITHQVDMDQHFVPLGFTAGSGWLTVKAPVGPAYAPPGDYMLFIVNGNGVPSVAEMVHLPGPDVEAPASPASGGPDSGYWMLGSTGEMYGFGQSVVHGTAPALAKGARATNFAPTPSGNGYWIVSNRGDVYGYGDARHVGGNPALQPGEEMTSVSSARDGQGYWLFTNKGRAFAYGSAPVLGDMTGTPLNGGVIGSVATSTGLGYYMVATDGGIFAFGDARFLGSMGATKLNQPVVGLTPGPDGTGYWLVASDGGIFSFGVPFRGSMGSTRLNQPVTGAVAYGDGYLMVAGDGGIFSFSNRPFLGSLGHHPPPNPIVAARIR